MMKKQTSIWNDKNYGMKVLSSNWYRTMFQLQDAYVHASILFFYEKGLQYIPLPITTSSVSSPMGLGSDSLPVSVILNGRKVYLADSMQFLLEYSLRMSERGCFYLMPSFRGEGTDERHLSQFFHSEAEIYGDLASVMELVGEYISSLCKYYLEHLPDEILKWTDDLEHLKKFADGFSIPRITYSQAVAELSQYDGATELIENKYVVITPSGERKLLESHGGCLWVTNYHKMVVPFYQAHKGDFAENADLLMGIGETVGAGERHISAEDVKRALREHNIDTSEYEWYIKMKETASVKTAGFGMGMERFLLWLLRHDDIRDCQIVSRIDGSQMIP